MLIYFHKNKFGSKKGQMAPFFILILVILLMMALVTVNLSKVGFIKTDASNSVDAGALAAGSVMASVFNSLAQSNSSMEAAYWEFYATVSAQFVIAIAALTTAYITNTSALGYGGSALGLACVSPCAAIAPAGSAVASTATSAKAIGYLIKTIHAIIVSVSAYHVAQYFFYQNIRTGITKGRNQAVVLGHKFTFMNSGIMSKLRQASAPADLIEQRLRNNYREEFSNFLDNTVTSGEESSYSNEEYTYPWQDGQGRQHFVRTRAAIDPVDDYKLTVTAVPFLVELAVLYAGRTAAYATQASLITAGVSYKAAAAALTAACGAWTCCMNPWTAAFCCPSYKSLCAMASGSLGTGNGASTAALASMTTNFFLLGGAWAGLLPSPLPVDNSLVKTAVLFTICWINDIEHNRRVTVETTQHHEGIDLGLWQMRYPDAAGNTNSSSVVNFNGTGSIYPPILRHDADIVETD